MDKKFGLQQTVKDVEQHIIVLSGPLLATSGIIAGLDVVTNNFIANNAPGVGAVLGLIWAICLMLTLDFQVLVLGVRARRVYISNKSNSKKIFEMALAFIIAAALGYVSLQMGSIFSRMMGTSLTMAQAQQELGINPIALIYERSAMVMLLIFMSGWLRDDDPVMAQESVPAQGNSLARDDMAMILSALGELQTLRQVVTEIQQQQSQPSLPVTPAQPMLNAPETPNRGDVETEQGIDTPDEMPVLELPEKPIGYGTSKQSYGEQIEALYKDNPEITISEVMKELNCSRNTAQKWLERCKPAE